MAPTAFLCDRRGCWRGTAYCGSCQSPCTPTCADCTHDLRDAGHQDH